MDWRSSPATLILLKGGNIWSLEGGAAMHQPFSQSLEMCFSTDESKRTKLMQNIWKKLDSKIVHRNKWYKVRKDRVVRPDGKLGYYHVIELGKSVAVIAIDSEDKIVLVEQFRYPTQMFSLELPGGSANKQNPLIAAKRELIEETGLVAKNWKFLGKLPSANGISDDFSYLYIARDLVQQKPTKQKEEGINVKKFSINKILSMIKRNQLTDVHLIAAVHLAILKKE